MPPPVFVFAFPILQCILVLDFIFAIGHRRVFATLQDIAHTARVMDFQA